MEYKLPLTHLKVSDRELLADVKRTAKKLKLKTLTVTQYKLNGKYLAATISTRFSGWVNALEKAGLQQSKNRDISTQELLANLKHVWDTLGRSPSLSNMQRPLSKYTGCSYTVRFGSWLKALEIFIKYMNCKNTAERKKLLGKIPSHNAERLIDTPQSLRFKVFQRDNFKCRICGASPATDPKIKLHADHIIAFSNGGLTTLSNLQTLCSRCNNGKGTS